MNALTFDPSAIVPFLQVVIIDIVLSGDNAIVIGLAVAGLPRDLRRKAMTIGIVAATVLRITFAAFAVPLLSVIGLTLAGGILLLWVCWKMWREARAQSEAGGLDAPLPPPPETRHSTRSSELSPLTRLRMRRAVTQIVLADVSMSLDNVLAVAGAAREHPWVLAFGLLLSIPLMAFASGFIARLLERFHWLVYVGLAIIAFVAVDMIVKGWVQVANALS